MLLNLPADGSVLMEDVTYKLGCFVIVGPESRNLLAKVAYGDVSNQAMPFGSSKEIYVPRQVPGQSHELRR